MLKERAKEIKKGRRERGAGVEKRRRKRTVSEPDKEKEGVRSRHWMVRKKTVIMRQMKRALWFPERFSVFSLFPLLPFV